MQNIDGTIGRVLPQKFKEKVQQAMQQGIGSVFGKVTGKVSGKMKDSVGSKISLSGRNEIFEDRNLNVYRRPGDAAQPFKRLEDIGVNEFADPLGTGSFLSAEVCSCSHLSAYSSIGPCPAGRAGRCHYGDDVWRVVRGRSGGGDAVRFIGSALAPAQPTSVRGPRAVPFALPRRPPLSQGSAGASYATLVPGRFSTIDECISSW